MRLQKFIAQCGISSRRAAEKLILDGRIEVNGKTITSLGTQINTETDSVTFNGKKVTPITTRRYFALNKPKGYITTRIDTHGRKTVFDLFPPSFRQLVPAGRLDKDTSGLLLFSNDGDFIYHLTHPRYELEKEYLVKCQNIISQESIKKLEKGVMIDNKKTSPAKITNLSLEAQRASRMQITIHEGRKRQIRKMFERIGHKVLELKRIRVGQIPLGDLKEGKFRPLKPKEVQTIIPSPVTGNYQ